MKKHRLSDHRTVGENIETDIMTIIDILLIGIGLSMDAFAVSICKGLSMRRISWPQTLAVSGAFGIAQAVMPLIGWLLGSGFSAFIDKYDHWVAFVLLAFIGIKMAVEAIREMKKENGSSEEERNDKKLDIKELLILAVATSLDALAVGVSFAFLDADIIQSSLIIGAVTFGICIAGVMIGFRFGAKYKCKAEIAGGVILFLIGLRILLEGLGFRLL